MYKNFKWILLGILGFLSFIAFAAAIVALVMSMMKGEAYQLSLSAVKSNYLVVEQIGEPIAAGWFVTGNVHTNGPDGKATLQYSLEGTNSHGTVYVYATRKMGEWTLDEVVVKIESNGNRIQVIDPMME